MHTGYYGMVKKCDHGGIYQNTLDYQNKSKKVVFGIWILWKVDGSARFDEATDKLNTILY